MIGIILLAAVCISSGNTEKAEGFATAICKILGSEVEVKEKKGQKFTVKVELDKQEAQEFSNASDDTEMMLNTICLTGSRIFGVKSLKWELKNPVEEVIFDNNCKLL